MASVYNHSAYSHLPMLAEAGQMFDIKNGNSLVKELGALFQKHETDRAFGLVLNHRHFTMSPDERLVEYAGTSVPWDRMLNKIQPSNWLFSTDNECLPYEFEYSINAKPDDKDGTPADPKYHQVVQSFTDLLR